MPVRSERRHTLVWILLAFGVGVLAVRWLSRAPGSKVPAAPAVVVQLREVARLETLEVSVYKKIDFTPDPKQADSLWGELAEWAKTSLRSPRGRAILFADVHLGLDASTLDLDTLAIQGDAITVALPPITAKVELKPGETEVIASNLTSDETAQLFQKAKEAFEAEVLDDPKLKARAKASAERSVGMSRA